MERRGTKQFCGGGDGTRSQGGSQSTRRDRHRPDGALGLRAHAVAVGKVEAPDRKLVGGEKDGEEAEIGQGLALALDVVGAQGGVVVEGVGCASREIGVSGGEAEVGV